jgi:hypothetical protein
VREGEREKKWSGRVRGRGREGERERENRGKERFVERVRYKQGSQWRSGAEWFRVQWVHATHQSHSPAWQPCVLYLCWQTWWGGKRQRETGDAAREGVTYNGEVWPQ